MHAASFCRKGQDMRRCIIHIGTHKTGSTSLQRYLHANATALAGAGILYPVAKGENAHHAIFREVSGKARAGRARTGLADLRDRLRRSDADVAILSSELFSVLPPSSAAMAALARRAVEAGFTPEIVLYVRPQHLLFNSLYTQRTKMLAEARPFAAFAEAMTARSSYEFNAIVAPWMAAGVEAVTAIPFSVDVIGAGIEQAFWNALGLADRVASIPGLIPLRQHNIANGPRAVELGRRLAGAAAGGAFGPNDRHVRRFAQREAERRHWNTSSFAGLTDALRDRVRDHFAAANETFARAWWERSWQDVFAAGIADVEAAYDLAWRRFAVESLARRPLLSRAFSQVSMRAGDALEHLVKGR